MNYKIVVEKIILKNYILFFLEFPYSIGITETTPSAVRQLKLLVWSPHVQTGLVIRAKMPPPPEPRFASTTGWENTQRALLSFCGRSLTAEF